MFYSGSKKPALSFNAAPGLGAGVPTARIRTFTPCFDFGQWRAEEAMTVRLLLLTAAARLLQGLYDEARVHKRCK
jgi:hypothetical protein